MSNRPQKRTQREHAATGACPVPLPVPTPNVRNRTNKFVGGDDEIVVTPPPSKSTKPAETSA